jgi:aminopeptidase 2
MFKRYIAGDRNAIHPGLRDQVFGVVLANGTEEDFNAPLEIIAETTNDDESVCILGNMGCVTTPELVQKTRALPFSDTCKDQDASPTSQRNTNIAH